ncbi:hypothetical protein [Paenibacillus tepidiphilus]|uniref:hypothetical protein n=1 Tax=Paenibacillus tepidiphilus TaxID=2608683 RepID=UPI003B849D5A
MAIIDGAMSSGSRSCFVILILSIACTTIMGGRYSSIAQVFSIAALYFEVIALTYASSSLAKKRTNTSAPPTIMMTTMQMSSGTPNAAARAASALASIFTNILKAFLINFFSSFFNCCLIAFLAFSLILLPARSATPSKFPSEKPLMLKSLSP